MCAFMIRGFILAWLLWEIQIVEVVALGSLLLLGDRANNMGQRGQ